MNVMHRWSFKQTYIDSSKEDIVIIKSPVGMPGRAIRNKFIDDVNKGEKKPFKCPYHCIVTCDYQNSPYCIALALLNARKGNLEHGLRLPERMLIGQRELFPSRN